MPKHKDWYPSGRQDQLNFVKRWISTFTEASPGDSAKKNWQVWGIPEETFREFATAYSEAQSAFEAVVISGTRGGPLGKAADEKLSTLEKICRAIHRRFISSPPIPPEGMALLGVKERDTSRTRPEIPVRAVSVRVSNPELHMVALNLGPGGGEQDVSGFKYTVRVGILAPDGKIPERSPNATWYMTKVPVIPEDLPRQFDRSRRRETWTFSGLETGMTVYFAVAYLNSRGETGPWVMVQAIIT